MTDLKRARHVFRSGLQGVVLFLMVALAAVVLLGVGFRKFGAALVWYDEVASILLAWLTYYGAALAALERQHIGFPKIVESLSPRWRRAALLLGETIVIAFFALMAWSNSTPCLRKALIIFGPRSTTYRTTGSLQSPAPASRVSRMCSSKESSGAITAAMPPWAQFVAESDPRFFVTRPTVPREATRSA